MIMAGLLTTFSLSGCSEEEINGIVREAEALLYEASQEGTAEIPGEEADSRSGDAGSEEDEAVIDEFLGNFELLAAVPRQSKHEKEISDFLKGWVEEKGFEVKQNEANDLIFDVPATVGFENLPLTALQAHIDMVCVADEDKDFDPVHDPISIMVDREKGILTADGTTLGADDGAGVAMIMGIVEGGMDHGPLRVIFTTDEEVNMTGALALTAEDLEGVKYVINVDSEQSDTVTISSAAGATIVASAEPEQTETKNDKAVIIEIAGLLGGHSGIMIDQGRCNGIIALGEVLSGLYDVTEPELAEFTGGIADNAIPSGASAVVMIPSGDEEKVLNYIKDEEAALQKKYEGIEEALEISLKEADAVREVFAESQTKGILDYLAGTIDGVYTMSEDMEGLVESSSNLGQIRLDMDGIEIRHNPRSSDAGKLKEIEEHQAELTGKCGLSVEITEATKAWPVKTDSRLIPKITEVYLHNTGEEMKVAAIHAGLECGVFAELSEGIDIASIGPDVTGAHSPDETLYLDSIPKVWHLLEGVLISLED